ncbi:TrlF family AAA-like ATPase [Actinomadura luteofluorescens]|uniref:TrlF family AAA-like ATPase n=1 Tax=Actinomadura luteofluorescens TaxID=46163 RepID=UPI0034789BA8
MSRWFKCDLQVGTPAWGFTLPGDTTYDFDDPADRKAFSDRYMAALKERGIEVIALAEHHSAKWLDDLREAGERAGITVFPGVEVTTGSGADGVHLILVGGLEKTSQDIDYLLDVCCGFDKDRHPRFDPRTNKPAPARKSIDDLLESLPPGWLVIAPHALCDNGIASKKSIEGSLRWKAMHHDRLSALDVGRGDDEKQRAGGKSWNQRFRARDLDDLPAVKRLAFVNTSDAYRLDALGTRFTWIRMEEPTLEGLRQAFLDFGSRILRDCDERLKNMPDGDPNRVEHSWLQRLHLGGTLGNSKDALTLEFTPGLNVIIGGRGAGKSTVVSGIRQIYGDVEGLPEGLSKEAKAFQDRVFGRADLTCVHRLPVSGEEQAALWSKAEGQRTARGGQLTPTTFPVRVFAQKELFERVAGDADDVHSSSRNLLKLVDEALDASGTQPVAAFEATLAQGQNSLTSRITERLQAEREVGQLDALRARTGELSRQVEHLDDPATQERRRRNEQINQEHRDLEAHAESLRIVITELEKSTNALLPPTQPSAVDGPPVGVPGEHYAELGRIRTALRTSVLEAVAKAAREADAAKDARRSGEWADRVRAAREDDKTYQAELAELGVDTAAYLSLREDLAQMMGRIRALEASARKLPSLRQQEAYAAEELDVIHDNRRRLRQHFLGEIARRSGTLRFAFQQHGDWGGWERDVRTLLGLRSDGYIEEVRSLARWLWDCAEESTSNRVRTWRTALIDNDFNPVSRELPLRSAWWTKLTQLDQAVRIRLCSLLADDVVVMKFLREGGAPEKAADWQEVTQGSPGQRSAAMLSFVFHQGEEPLVLDQPEDDLDTTLISELIVAQLRGSRWRRQIIVVTHNANIPVLGDADRVIVLENTDGSIRIRNSTRPHMGSIDVQEVRTDIQNVMEGGVSAFVMRERKYDNELSNYRKDAASMQHGKAMRS